MHVLQWPETNSQATNSIWRNNGNGTFTERYGFNWAYGAESAF